MLHRWAWSGTFTAAISNASESEYSHGPVSRLNIIYRVQAGRMRLSSGIRSRLISGACGFLSLMMSMTRVILWKPQRNIWRNHICFQEVAVCKGSCLIYTPWENAIFLIIAAIVFSAAGPHFLPRNRAGHCQSSNKRSFPARPTP